MSDNLLVVVDTNVWIEVFSVYRLQSEEQPYHDIFDALFAEEFVPVYCRETLDELLRTISGARIRRKYDFTEEIAAYAKEFFTNIFYEAGAFERITDQRRFIDPSGRYHLDDKFIELALIAKAKLIVSEDVDFRVGRVLSLLRASGVEVLYPGRFKARLDGVLET